jgi:glycosyltransferase involved in cell wall biosynthesis
MTIVQHRSLHVAQISFFSDIQARPPSELLDAWPSLSDVAEAACGGGIRVSVVQASSHTQRIDRRGVSYYFQPFGEGQRHAAQNAAFGELLRRLAPDICHVHGLGFPRDSLLLASLAPGVPIILQDHANGPPRFWRRPLWRRQMSVTAGIAFCALPQARPFSDAGLIHSEMQLYEIPESTSRFTPGDREDARRITGLDGDPAVLWVGHLNANKDPLIVLDGISAAVRELPRLQLFCCYGMAPLLREVQDRIAKDPALRGRVHLIGRVSHERVEQAMRAADLFVLGSHREGSGYSVIEALACGLPPVVTDIPSYRSLTGEGSVGKLWPCADPLALCEALKSIAGRCGPEMRATVRAHFERELSFTALGVKLVAMYEDVLARKHGSRPAAAEVAGAHLLS